MIRIELERLNTAREEAAVAKSSAQFVQAVGQSCEASRDLMFALAEIVSPETSLLREVADQFRRHADACDGRLHEFTLSESDTAYVGYCLRNVRQRAAELDERRLAAEKQLVGTCVGLSH